MANVNVLNLYFSLCPGTVLSSVGVTCEEDTEDGKKNDDRILDCCLAIDTAPAAKEKEGMRTVHRDTVLLTHDRCGLAKYFLLGTSSKIPLVTGTGGEEETQHVPRINIKHLVR